MEIRKTEAQKHSASACIVGLTAHARREVSEECLRAGMDQVLIKPVKMQELFPVVEGCLAGRKNAVDNKQ
jgi:CheY-like chemotaxis protein